MLYERWREVAAGRPDAVALSEAPGGGRWTFRELARMTEGGEETDSPVVFIGSSGADFVLSVLRAWRSGRPICPLEPGQIEPRVREVPKGCAHLKTTSASTGTAKLIAFTGEQLAADAANIVMTMGLRPEWPNIGVISLAHSYGFSNLVLPLLLHGIPLALEEGPLPEVIRSAVARLGDVTLPAVPAMWRAWHEAGVLTENIRLAISAGAPLPLPLEADAHRSSGIKIHNFYGASECGGIAYDRSAEPRTSACCAGTPLCNVHLDVGGDGCLTVHSRAVGTGYLPDGDPRLGDGRFQTGDFAEIVAGEVFLRGRAGDMINVAGRKISPEAIERELQAHPAVRHCLVFGVPAVGERAETIVACLELRLAVDSEELRQFLLRSLPAWQVPRDWWRVESLQPNQRGKLSRADWRREYLSKTSSNPP